MATGTAGLNAAGLQTIGDAWRTAQGSQNNVPRGIKTLRATASGNGSTTVFNFPHGMKYAPAAANAFGTNAVGRAAQAGPPAVDATNVTVTFSAAPAAGTNNIGLLLEVFN